MNKKYKWLDSHKRPILENSIFYDDIIECQECHYTTNPIITKFKIENDYYGLLTLPKICPRCQTNMIEIRN